MINKTTAMFIALFAFSCGDGDFHKAGNPEEAASEFIRASLNGNFDKAKFYMLQDDVNTRFFGNITRDYNQLSQEAKRANREANIRPVKVEKVNDSLTKFKYFQTANEQDTVTLHVVKTNNEWLVDLKWIK